jgi:hypothetical protein
MLISVEGIEKNQLESGQEIMGDAAVLSHFSLIRNIDQNRPVRWSIVVKESFGSPFFTEFSSDRIPKATKDVNIYFFTHNFTFILLLTILWQ